MYDKRARAVIKFVSNTSFIQRSNIIDTIARPELRFNHDPIFSMFKAKWRKIENNVRMHGITSDGLFC